MSPLLTLHRSPDLHHPQTTANLSALLLAPINSYQSVLTLLALQQYSALLTQQPYSTRRTLAHSLISSVLKNETIIETPEDVNGILELCHVLVRDQQDAGTGPGAHNQQLGNKDSRRGPYHSEREELAEEQGWVARMVHLFRSNNLGVQFEVCSVLPAVFATLPYQPADPANGKTPLRDGRRADAVHISCAHYFSHQALQAV